MSLKRFKPALADCQEAVALQATSPQTRTLNRLSRCQIALGLIDDATRTLQEVLQLEPQNPQALADQARIARIQQDLLNIAREKSKGEWTYVMFGLDRLEKEVDSPPLAWKITRVEALLGKKRLDDAALLASDLLRQSPSDPDVLWVRGKCSWRRATVRKP